MAAAQQCRCRRRLLGLTTTPGGSAGTKPLTSPLSPCHSVPGLHLHDRSYFKKVECRRVQVAACSVARGDAGRVAGEWPRRGPRAATAPPVVLPRYPSLSKYCSMLFAGLRGSARWLGGR